MLFYPLNWQCGISIRIGAKVDFLRLEYSCKVIGLCGS